MTKKFIFSITFIFFLCIAYNANAATFAVGYFNNNSNFVQFDYLEEVLPNSFASAMKSMFGVDIIRPSELASVLEQEYPEIRDMKFPESHIPRICDTLGSDFLVYGSFTPLPGNRINIYVRIFDASSGEEFSFVDFGKLETEIFGVVDRIIFSLYNLYAGDYILKKNAIRANSRIGFITNLSGAELNSFYLPFLENKIPLLAIQGNDLLSFYPENQFDSFRQTYLENTGLKVISDSAPVLLHFGTWQGQDAAYFQKQQNEVFRRYYYNYPQTKLNAIDNIAKSYGNNLDYLFIVGFNNSRDEAWLRCFDLREKEIIWLQGSIEDDSDKYDNSISSVAETIIDFFPKTFDSKPE